MVTTTHKRAVIIAFLALVVISSFILHLQTLKVEQSQQDSQNDIRVLTPEWGVAATLANMGFPPTAMGSERIYNKYYPHTPLPNSVIDVGLRGQPNMELMAQIDTNIAIDTNFYDFTRQYYGAHTKVTTIDFGLTDNKKDTPPDLSVYKQAVLDIGNAIGQPKAAQDYFKKGLETIEEDGAIIRQKLGDDRQFFVTTFASNTQLKTYGVNHPIALAAQMMGLDLITLGTPDSQGYATLPIHILYDLPKDTCLILVDPITTLDEYEVPRSPIWQRSAFYSPDACLYKIDTVWARGGFNTLIVFAENLKNAVTTQRDSAFSGEYLTGQSGHIHANQETNP